MAIARQGTTIFDVFQIRGFDPQVNLEQYASRKLAGISKLVPHDSRFSARIERQGIGFRLDLSVQARGMKFTDLSLANDPRVAIDRLSARISERLVPWLESQARQTSEVFVCAVA